MTTTDRLVGVKTYKRPIGKSCMHCGRRATVTARRKFKAKGAWMELAVRYCDRHAAELGAV